MINAYRRRPKKMMRVADAARLLDVSRSTIKNMIAADEIRPAFRPPPGSTSPIKLYEAEIIQIAKARGIL